MPACKVCGSWFVKIKPHEELCDKCECALSRLYSYVAPVVHGRWIDKGEYAVCTECGGRSGTQYDGVEPIPLMTQFCPNCGAKMDGGVDDATD